MAFDYGFGSLENELVELFHKLPLDFEKAEELLTTGADINTLNKDCDENILSEILMGYHSHYMYSTTGSYESECIQDSTIGMSMCDTIRFFLSHGFDVNKYNGLLGAQCLYALVLSTFDRYMIEATKILFDAGAKNRTISDNADEDETPWDFVGTEGSFQDTCEGNHALGNLYEALYQIYQAIDEEKPYNCIDSYECSVGKKIIKVLASPNNDNPTIFYSMDLPNFKKENCFTSDLYFVYEGGVLRTTKYADFWVDSILTEAELVDVSEYFPGIVGSNIKSFSFGHKAVRKESTAYTQPITKIEMESGECVRFSINFGDVEDKDRVAFFELI